ncbi:hypothetical protein D1B31_18385 [Neobacillus notoginsengisoli]|uniref:Uncharacterized protein n=1 Tax=Neobacillus notoginsengisoli TaxID=1578198 RepID=A0A417YQD7_9BACI|nr:hypothetical protein [Neobacillus notoginsengisoli]RHW36052.1 hypothetical protein D1B31_18385 [Neobacillus notoginsengisoli]
MKKRYLLVCLALIISITGFDMVAPKSSAQAKGLSVTYLNLTDTTRSTSRVTLNSGEKLRYYVNVYRGDIQFAIFKNGVMYSTGRVGPGVYQDIVSGAGPGEYSLRLYCGTRDAMKTGCSVPSASIEAY